VTQEARRIKTPQELRLLEVNASMVMDMLAAFEASIAPGINERELLAVLTGVMVRGGGEYLATTTVCSGPNTNPWRGGHRQTPRDRRSRLRRHRHDRDRDRGDVLLCLSDVPGRGCGSGAGAT
jgi:Xaa-Pro aminopeptidase